ncbi:MAG: ABC transporter permease [Armatimonadetes bacterium]|nr:ABC transporter permease [Armatimonadota bacterium]
MNFRAIQALAGGVILESIRRKDLWVVAILGFLILLSASVLGFFGFQGLEAFVKDLAGSVVGLFSTIIAILTASRLVPEEIKNRTLYPLISRPINRFELLAGKLWGAIVVTWIAFLVLCGLTALALTFFHVHFEVIMLQYIFCKMLGLAVVCSISLLLSLLMTIQAAVTFSFIVAFGTSMITRAMTMGYDSASPLVQSIFRVLNAILPQYDLFDLGSRAANSGWGTVPLWVIGALAAYAVVYISATLALSWAKFRRQAI